MVTPIYYVYDYSESGYARIYEIDPDGWKGAEKRENYVSISGERA